MGLTIQARAYFEDAIEVLDNAQGEWLSVNIPYCPMEMKPLKEAADLIQQGLTEAQKPESRDTTISTVSTGEGRMP